MTEPRASLVIATYRRGSKIGPTLTSVMRQTRLPDEIIVVNDGGDADTAAYIGAEFPTVRLVNAAHGGAARARNHGAQLATGEVIVFIDDDDAFKPHAVETLLDELDEFPQAVAAYADHELTNHVTGEHYADHHQVMPAFERLRALTPLATKGQTRLFGKPLYRAMLQGNLLQQPWAVRRATFLAAGGFHPGVDSCDDWDLHLRICRQWPVALSDRVISDHFIEQGRQHGSLVPNRLEDHARATSRHLKAIGLSDPISSWIMTRKLGGIFKAIGDNSLAQSPAKAWRMYARSARYWPFDYVVAARLVIWPLAAAVGMFRRSPGATPGGDVPR